MKRLLALLPVVFLAAACGSSGGATKTVTVTRTVTSTVTPGASEPTSGDSSSSSAEGAAPDACSVLTQAEAEAIAGTPLMKPEGAGPGSAPSVMCQFTGPTTGPTAQVEVYVGDGAKQQLQIERDNLGHAFTTVPGIGDQCLMEDNFIFVEKNGLWASIHLVLLNDAKDNVAPLQTGIRELTDRLP